MAKVTLNSSISGLSGNIDGWVYRQQNGRTSVMPLAERKKSRPTAAQRSSRDRFRAAQRYAAEVLSDPLRREMYQKLGAASNRPPNALLISNFLTPPTIERVEKNGYTGNVDHSLQVIVSDLVEVVDVAVQLRSRAGVVFESGPAVKDHGIWVYRTRSTLPPNSDCQIEITARNRARAEAKMTVSGS